MKFRVNPRMNAVVAALFLSLAAVAGAGHAELTQAPLAEASLQAARLPVARVTPGQYSAVLHVQQGNWQVLDPSGASLQVEATGCPGNPLLPPGLWLLTRDAAGAPELIAPSATPLPPGHAGHIALRACGSAQSGRDAAASLQVPEALIATLEQNASAILIVR